MVRGGTEAVDTRRSRRWLAPSGGDGGKRGRNARLRGLRISRMKERFSGTPLF